MESLKLHDYQEKALEFLSKHDKAALFLEMGAGKTAIMLAHIKAKKLKTLVVCPLTVMGSWVREIQKWDTFKNLTISTLHGNKKNINFLKEADIYIINYEGATWLLNTIIKHKQMPFRNIIYDESTKLKNHESKGFKIAQQLSNLMQNITILTGTPVPNGYLGLYSQFYLLDKGLRLGKNITAYRNEFFYPIGEIEFGKFILKNKQMVDKITNRIKDITFRIPKDELPKLKTLKDNLIEIDVLDNIKQDYIKFKNNAVTQLDGQDICATSAGALLNKLRQFTSGFLYNEKTTYDVHSAKIDRLKDIVSSLNGTPLLIAYNYKYEAKIIKDNIKNANFIGSGVTQQKTNELIEAWNKKEISILCCNPASIGFGLNLQDGGNNILWFSLTYNCEHYHQLIGRLYRQSQKNDVINHILIFKDSIDEIIYKVLQDKTLSQDDFLKKLINNIISTK